MDMDFIDNVTKWQRLRLLTLIAICKGCKNVRQEEGGNGATTTTIYEFAHASHEMGFLSKHFETVTEAAQVVGWQVIVAGNGAKGGLLLSLEHTPGGPGDSVSSYGSHEAAQKARESVVAIRSVSSQELEEMQSALNAAENIEDIDYNAVVTSFVKSSADLWAQMLGLLAAQRKLVPSASPFDAMMGGGSPLAGMMGGGGGGGAPFGGMSGGMVETDSASLKAQLLAMQQQPPTANNDKQEPEATPEQLAKKKLLETLRNAKISIAEGVASSAASFTAALEEEDPSKRLEIVVAVPALSPIFTEEHRLYSTLVVLSSAITRGFATVAGATEEGIQTLLESGAIVLNLAATISAQRKIKESGIRIKFPLSALEQILLFHAEHEGGYTLETLTKNAAAGGLEKFNALRAEVEFPEDGAELLREGPAPSYIGGFTELVRGATAKSSTS